LRYSSHSSLNHAFFGFFARAWTLKLKFFKIKITTLPLESYFVLFVLEKRGAFSFLFVFGLRFLPSSLSPIEKPTNQGHFLTICCASNKARRNLRLPALALSSFFILLLRHGRHIQTFVKHLLH
jgi:hypothetical protein